MACARLEAEVYPEQRVSTTINSNFIPVHLHVKDNKAAFERFGASWTPTILVLDSEGKERHRIEGFVGPDDLIGQLYLGLGHSAYENGKYEEAEKFFRQVLKELPKSDAAPEAQYWAGVSKYKRTNDGSALAETAKAFKQRYSDSSWAKKAAVWGG